MEFQRPFSVLDGGLSTALELAGHDLDHDLWTARLLAERPNAVVESHLAYLRAGAEILITSSYQASTAGFVAHGHPRSEAIGLIGLTTELARTAIARFQGERPDEPVALVAASVGPYGAVLADGSEYRGDYEVGPGLLADFHAERLEILVASRPDLLACETIPSAVEAAALVAALSGLATPPVWISFSCRDEAHTSAGDPIEDAVATVLGLRNLVSVGVNCSAPEHVGPLLERIATVTELPLVAYANSGQRWDATANCWRGDPSAAPDEALLDRWVDAGAQVIGGCCGVGPSGIAALRDLRDDWFDPGPGGVAVA